MDRDYSDRGDCQYITVRTNYDQCAVEVVERTTHFDYPIWCLFHSQFALPARGVTTHPVPVLTEIDIESPSHEDPPAMVLQHDLEK